MTRHGRSYNLQVWTDCLCEQLDVRELHRHRASDEAIEHRRRMAYGGSPWARRRDSCPRGTRVRTGPPTRPQEKL